MSFACSHNYALVALSVLIAMFASYAALDLAGRVTAAGGWTRAVWLLGGAGAMGIGIWSMHYIGMLACRLPIPVAYHWPTVLLSLSPAIFASAIALYVVSRQKMGAYQAFAGSVLMGAGISSMHYIGMAAMRLPATRQYNFFLVVLSVVFAVLISLAALWITFHFRDEKAEIGWRKTAGAVVMGAGIANMHYIGMAAASFTPSGMPANLSRAVSISTLGTAGIAAATLIVLGLALLTSWVDRRFAAQALQRQEEKLHQSEAYLSEAQRLSHTGSFGWRTSSGEINWSEETFRIFQYNPTTKPTVELILQRVHPDDTAFVKQTIERASQDGKDFDFERRLLMRDDSVKHLRIVAHAERDKSGEIEFVGAVMDITVAKEAREKLRHSQEKYRDLIEVSPDPIVVIDAQGNFALANQAALIFAGCTEEEFIGSSVADTYVAEERAMFWQRLDELKTEGASRFERRFLRKNGDIILVEVSHSPMRGGYFQAVLRDITERRRAEEELRRSEEYLAEGQRISHTGSWAWNTVSGVWFWSPESLRIFGMEQGSDDFSFEKFLERIHPEDRSKVERALSGAVHRKTAFEQDIRALLPNGVTKYVHFLGRPFLDDSGEFTEFIGVVMDITERKHAEEALRASEQLARGQVEALAQSLDVLATAPAPEKFVGQMLSTIGRLLNAQSVALWLFDESNNSLVLRLLAEGAKPAAPDPEHPFMKDPLSWKQNPIIQELLFTAGPVVCEEVETDPRVNGEWRDHLKQKGTKRFLAVPILVGGQVRGLIGIRHADRASYRPEEIELTQALAHQVMLAIQLNEFAEQGQRAAVLEERNRMARDIHDTLAQGFTGVIVQLEAAEDAMSCGRQKEADKHLHRAGGLARQSLNEARRSVHALRPDALERDNLWEALKGIIKSTTAGTALRTTCELRGKLPELPPIWQENLLHIGQEALTNTLKYAHAQNFRARLSCNAKAVRLELRDDGTGFELNDRHGGLGLTGMRERVKQMGGTLSVTSSHGKGTKVVVVSPYNE